MSRSHGSPVGLVPYQSVSFKEHAHRLYLHLFCGNGRGVDIEVVLELLSPGAEFIERAVELIGLLHRQALAGITRAGEWRDELSGEFGSIGAHDLVLIRWLNYRGFGGRLS